MTKVLIIIGKLYIGGAEKVGRDIGFFADKQEFEIHYLVFGDETGAYEPELEAAGCRIIHMPPPSENYRAYYAGLKKLIAQEHYDVIHSHTMFNSGWAMMAGKACGVPVRIAHSHSIRGPEKRGLLKNTYEKTMRRLILRDATKLVACGQSAGEWLYGNDGFRDRGLLIYNGIDLSGFAYSEKARTEIRTQYGLDGKFVIGHVGHLAAVKNQAFLLGMMPTIRARQPDAVLLLLGEGSDRGMLEQKIAELGLGDRVIMTGNVSNVGEYLSAMDVFAFPSLYEGMPLSMVEAQANGLPCVISDRVPEDVHLTALVTALPLDDAAPWVERLCGSRREHPEEYGQRMQELGFDTGKMTEKIYDLYRNGEDHSRD